MSVNPVLHNVLLATHLGPPVSLISSLYSRTPRVFRKWSAAVKRQLPNLDPKDLLPIGIEVAKGAIIVGNRSTPELLVAEFRNTRGTYGIVPVSLPVGSWAMFAHCNY